jgi:hypothetical protein
MKKSVAEQSGSMASWWATTSGIPEPRRTITPPKAIGWVLISAGAVTILHSLAMRKDSSGG